jgi:uncharacterized membrane protein
MKSPLMIVGIILIVLGIFGASYQSFTYPKQEKVAEIGDLKVTAETDKTVHIPPYLGGLAIAAGLVLVVISRKR